MRMDPLKSNRLPSGPCGRVRNGRCRFSKEGNMTNRTKHLLMISLDAVDNADVDFLLTLPNFSALARRGTLVRNVDSVFVSNTYPAHSSIITGVYPNRHGIIENVWTQPGNPRPDWRCNAGELRAPALYEKAREAGIPVCSILYPVTCGAGIRWNLPEVAGKMGLLRRAGKILCGGSPGFILSSLFRNRRYLTRFGEPELDDFSAHTAAQAIRQKRPGLLLLHLIDVDDHKHRFGPGSEPVRDALRRHDGRLGLLLAAAREAWPGEETAAVIFSDHGCLKVHTAYDPNELLRRRGLIRAPGRRSGDFDAFFHNAGGTSFLKILRPGSERQARKAVEELLRGPAVARTLSKAEMDVSGMGKEFLCGIEAAEGFCFGEKEKGQHGYGLAHEGYRPFYLAAGPGIARGAVRRGGCIVDICPLAADLLGIPLWDMDGQRRLAKETTKWAN